MIGDVAMRSTRSVTCLVVTCLARCNFTRAEMTSASKCPGAWTSESFRCVSMELARLEPTRMCTHSRKRGRSTHQWALLNFVDVDHIILPISRRPRVRPVLAQSPAVGSENGHPS